MDRRRRSRARSARTAAAEARRGGRRRRRPSRRPGRARRRGRPARPGPTIARSSSSGDIGVIASVRAASRSPKPRTDSGWSKKSARRVATTRTRLSARERPPGCAPGLRAFVLVLDQREDLLQLVEDDQQLGVRVGQDPSDRADKPELVLLEVLEQGGRRLDGHAEQRRLELTQRVGSREQVDHVPALGARDRAPAERPGRGRRGRRRTSPIPTARRRTRNRALVVARPGAPEPARQRLAAEEVAASGLEERSESLVRVADLPGRRRFAPPSMRAAEGGGELQRVREAASAVLRGRPRDRAVDRGRELGPQPRGPRGAARYRW